MKSFLANTWDLLLKGGMMAAGFLRGAATGQNRELVLLLVVMVADYLSGVSAAWLGKSKKTPGGKLSSEAGRRGLLNKALMLLIILMSYLLDTFVSQGNAMFQSAVTWFYISNEALSLLENLALAGVPIPSRLRRALESAQEKEPAAANE